MDCETYTNKFTTGAGKSGSSSFMVGSRGMLVDNETTINLDGFNLDAEPENIVVGLYAPRNISFVCSKLEGGSAN